jgi:hypothetical protein
MRSFRKELWFEAPGRRAFLNITPQVEAALKESGAMHITAHIAFTVADFEPERAKAQLTAMGAKNVSDGGPFSVYVDDPSAIKCRSAASASVVRSLLLLMDASFAPGRHARMIVLQWRSSRRCL